MSKRKILSELKKKNIHPLCVNFERSSPTPQGYASGWDIEFSESDEDSVYMQDKKCKFDTFMEFESLSDVIKFIKTLPEIPPK